MTTTTPLRRPGTARCDTCHHLRPIGQFSEQFVLDHDPQRWRRVSYTTCRQCRMRGVGKAAPGRAMQ